MEKVIDKPPITYFGGKGNIYNKILKYFPNKTEYKNYIEPYGGSAVILLKKPKTEVEVYNDLELNVYTFYKVLQDEALYKQFLSKAKLSCYHETISKECMLKIHNNDFKNDVDRAYTFWYANRTRRSGLGGFRLNIDIRRNMSKSISDFQKSIDDIKQFHNRWKNVIVLNRDAIDVIKYFDKPNTFIYLDPPYVHETRTNARYLQDANNEHHVNLIETLNNIEYAKFLLSGYNNSLYDRLNYNRVDFEIKTINSKNEPRIKVESLWFNYEIS